MIKFLKAIVSFPVALMLIFSLSACQYKNTIASSSSSPNNSSSADQDSPKAPLKDALELNLAAAGYGSTLVSGKYQLSSQIVDEGQLLPVYINPYPYGQEGISVPVTDTLLAQLEENMRAYLDAAGYVEESKEELFPYKDYLNDGTFYCEFGDMSIASHPDSLKILCSLDMSSVHGPEDFFQKLEEEPLIRAAYDYLGITVPRTSWDVTYNIQGEEYERTLSIWQEAQDSLEEIYNKSFRCVKVNWYPNSPDAQVLISITKTDTTLLYGAFPAVSAELAQASLVNDLDEFHSIAEVEIVYRGDMAPGYYVPCYQFYVHTNAALAEPTSSDPGDAEEYYIYRTPAFAIEP